MKVISHQFRYETFADVGVTPRYVINLKIQQHLFLEVGSMGVIRVFSTCFVKCWPKACT